MLLQRTEKLPEGPDWLHELNSMVKSGGKVQLRSHENDNDFTARYASIAKALAVMQDDVIDGEVVALD
jgi:ATP-dependent DNA ligase